MEYLTAKQFSEKWNISERRIIKLCNENRINGAVKNGMVWVIPEDTIKPSDKRSKISQYINTQKRVIVANINTPIGYCLITLLKKEGYLIEGICNKKAEVDEKKLDNITIWKVDYENKRELEKMLEETGKYYDGLIFIGIGQMEENKEWLIKEFAQKMNCESSIVLVDYLQDRKVELEAKFADKLKRDIGLRINAININIPNKDKIYINYNEIAEDISALLTKFRNTTGISITTDGGYLEFDKDGRTCDLESGKFYKAINNYIKNLEKGSTMWCASTMLEDEWTEEPAEMNFRVNNLEVANRGVNLERIFIFSKNKRKEFKNNKTLKIYMQSNINTMFVDYDEVKTKEPELLRIIGAGWDGIDLETLILDLPEGSPARGYISVNKKDIQRAYECFKKLREYAIDLKEILK